MVTQTQFLRIELLFIGC